jgi:transposase InsO family protein
MWGMQKFRSYLLGHHFVANVDHKPLVSMMRNKMNVMMEGWVDNIMQFDFTTQYVPGDDNVLADALSRQFDVIVAKTGSSVVTDVATASSTDSPLDIDASAIADTAVAVTPDVQERHQLIESAHLLGHFGVDAILKQLQQKYAWSGMRDDIVSVVAACVPCQRFNVSRQGYNPLLSVEASGVWDHVEVDLVGPIAKSADGYDYYLNLVDVLSGFVVLRALKGKAMDSVAFALWTIICEFGTPRILQSDNGSEFVNRVIAQLCETYGIEHRLITPYHPRANGLVERMNKEASRMLKKLMIGATELWDRHLPSIMLALNARHLGRVGATPFSLMFARPFAGFENFTSMALAVDPEVALANLVGNHAEFRGIVLPGVQLRTAKVRQDRIEHFNSSANVVQQLAVGDRVYAMDVTRSSKWDPVYEGPFTVAEVHPGGAYSLTDMTGDLLKRRFALSMLKKVSDAVPSWGESGIVTAESTPADVVDSVPAVAPDSVPAVTVADVDVTSPAVEAKPTASTKVKPAKSKKSVPADKHFIVDHIMDHKMTPAGYEYFVRWMSYGSDEDCWVKAADFDDQNIIKQYWSQHRRARAAQKKS